MSYLLKRIELEEEGKKIKRNIEKYLSERHESCFDIIIIDVFENVAKFHVASVYQNTSVIEFDLGSGSLSIKGSDRPVSMSVISEAIEVVRKFVYKED